MPFEVERRYDKNLEEKLSSESKLEKIYGGSDHYFSLSQSFLRVRDLKLTYPSTKTFQMMSLKKMRDGEVEEVETPVDAVAALKILEGSIGKPKVIVTVQRKEYSLRDLKVCIDKVKDLGNWTEIEKITKNRKEMNKALREIIEAFESIGVDRSQLVKDIYPTLLYKKLHKESK